MSIGANNNNYYYYYDNHQHLNKAVAIYNQSVIPIHCISTLSQSIPSQRSFLLLFMTQFICYFFTPATLPQDKTRLTAVATPHASAWLSVVPNDNLGLYLTPHEWRAVTRRSRIGADVNPEHSKCPLCHQHHNKSRHHATVAILMVNNQPNQRYS